MSRRGRRLLAAAALALALPAAAQELGRLFFTPEQRALLDLARRTQTAAASGNEAEGVALTGVVTRSDGRQTVWINGRPQPGAVASPRNPATAVIPLAGTGGSVRLRVGQTLDPISGRVEEGWRRPPRQVPARDAPAMETPRAGRAGTLPAPAAREAEEEADGPPPDARQRP